MAGNDLWWLLVACAGAALLALLAGGARWRRGAALLLAPGLLLLPVLLPFHAALGRAVAGTLCAWVTMRLVELVRITGSRRLSPRQRLWQVGAVFDPRLARRAPPRLALDNLLAITGYTALLALGLSLALAAPPAPRWEHDLCRWLGATLGIYALVDLLYAVLLFGNRLCGIEPPPLHRTPILSRSVQEFWSQRWARPVSGWLSANCLRPLLRRGWPRLGLGAAFLISALLHGYFIAVALGLWAALPMAAFFLLQFPVVLAERSLAVARWPAGAARAWTVTVLLLLAPLFLEPMMQLLDP